MGVYFLPTNVGSMEDVALSFARDDYVQGKSDLEQFECDVEAILGGDVLRFVEGGLGPIPHGPDPGQVETR